MFSEAAKKMEAEFSLRESVDNNAMRKDFAEIMASIIDFHSQTGITTKVYEGMDGLNSAELTERLPEALVAMQTELAKKRKTLAEYEQKLREDKIKQQGVQEDDKEPQTEVIPKEDEETAEGSDFMLDHLRERVKEVENLGEKDIRTMLVNYKKIRAIASGATAEYYLMQNQLAENPILGNLHNRDAKYKDLGVEPMKDMLFDMRFRLLDDKQDELYTKEKADEIERTITAMDGLDTAQLSVIKDIVKNNGDKLTKGSVNHVQDMYDGMRISSETFDVNSPNSIFEKDASGKPTKESINTVYLQILDMSPANGKLSENILFKEFLATSNDAEEFFKAAALDSKNITIPAYFDVSSDESLLEII